MATVTFTPNLKRHVECPTDTVAGASVRAVLEIVFAQNPKLSDPEVAHAEDGQDQTHHTGDGREECALDEQLPYDPRSRETTKRSLIR